MASKPAAELKEFEECLSLSAKRPLSGVAALALPFASPTGYGLGKSYRAIAPKKLAARLPAADDS